MTKPSGKRIALNKLSLTKRTVEALKPAAKSWIAWDDTLTGFGVRVQPTGLKSYIVNYRAGDGGRKAPNKRVVLGRHGGITAEQARHMAQRVLREAATGDGPASGRAEAGGMPCSSKPSMTIWRSIPNGPRAPINTIATYSAISPTGACVRSTPSAAGM